MGTTIHISVALHLLVLISLGIFGQGALDLTRRWIDTSPFQHIKLNNEPQNPKALTPGLGCFRAAGRVEGPVTKGQFILFTEALSKEVSWRWHGVEGNRYDKGTHPLPPRGAGQLTGSGRNLFFRFLSDQRPLRTWEAGPSGVQLLKDSHDKQMRVFFPGEAAKANARKRELQTEMQELTRVMEVIRTKRLFAHGGANLQWLDRWYAATAERRNSLAETFDHEGARVGILRQATMHYQKNRCVECRLMTETADAGRRNELYDAWQVSFGLSQEVGKWTWGPLKACWGKGLQYGCHTVQQDNGVVNLYETAVRLQNIGHIFAGKGHQSAEFLECKRDGSACGHELPASGGADSATGHSKAEIKSHSAVH